MLFRYSKRVKDLTDFCRGREERTFVYGPLTTPGESRTYREGRGVRAEFHVMFVAVGSGAAVARLDQSVNSQKRWKKFSISGAWHSDRCQYKRGVYYLVSFKTFCTITKLCLSERELSEYNGTWFDEGKCLAYFLGTVETYGITTLSTNDPKPSLKFEVIFCIVSAKRSPRADSFSLSSSMDLDKSIK